MANKPDRVQAASEAPSPPVRDGSQEPKKTLNPLPAKPPPMPERPVEDPNFPNGLPVKAIVLGVYEDRRWIPGQHFLIAKKSHFSHVWMEALGWEPGPDKMLKRHEDLPPRPRPEDHHGQGKFHLTGTHQKNVLNPVGDQKAAARVAPTSDPASAEPRKPQRTSGGDPTGSESPIGT